MLKSDSKVLDKVSVVVPIFNVENYLTRCIETIIHQDYENLEIILVDDGSTDDSGHICDVFADKDDRIIVIHQNNMGLSGARNSGIEVASGEYICFIDSDDYISFNYISRLISAMKKAGSDIAICDYIKGKEKSYSFNGSAKGRERTFSSEKALENWHKEFKRVETVAWNKLYRKSLFDSGIRYPVGLYFEDVPTTHRLVYEAQKVTFINDKLYYYYQRKKSIQGSVDDNKIIHKIKVQYERISWFKEKGMEKAYQRLVSKLLKHFIVCYCASNSEETCNWLINEYNEKCSLLSQRKMADDILFCLFKHHNNAFRKLYRFIKGKSQ